METPFIVRNSTEFVTEMDQFIPKEFQLPVGIAAAILALSAFLWMSLSKKEAAKVQFDTSVPSTPKSATVTESGTPIQQKTGTVFTPAGRRSARLARRKEE